MTTYKFCVAPGGTLVCYKSDNGLFKYTGSKAHELLEHIKNFSFYNFNSKTKRIDSNKYTYNMAFDSCHHRVVFEDVYKFKRKKAISIEDEIEELINIVRSNKIKMQKENELENIKKSKRLVIFNNAKKVICAATLAASLLFSSKANTNEKAVLNNTKVKTETEVQTKGVAFTNDNVTSKYIDMKNYMCYNEPNYIEMKDFIDVNNEEEKIEQTVNTTSKEVVATSNSIDENITINIEEYVKNYANINDVQIDETYQNDNLVNETISENQVQATQTYSGPVLTKSAGFVTGPSGGKETYYDLNMNRVVENMRNKGFDEVNYPYWVREDGVKMLGDYVMVAANLQVHPRGTTVETSLGTGIVCDTGDFAKTNTQQLDIATAWTKGR